MNKEISLCGTKYSVFETMLSYKRIDRLNILVKLMDKFRSIQSH